MAIVDDQLSYTLITELDGVQMSNTRYFEIDAIGDDPTNVSMLNDIVNDYYDSIKLFCSTAWKIVCAKLHNHTQQESDSVVFVTLLGTGVGDSHPQHQVVRFNMYAQVQPANFMVRGAFNQSGILEAKSLRGRVGNPADFDPLIQHLDTPAAFGGTGWSVSSLIRYNGTPPTPFTEEFANVNHVQVNTQFKTLKSRKTKFCAVS
jgi:hypothetical protein